MDLMDTTATTRMTKIITMTMAITMTMTMTMATTMPTTLTTVLRGNERQTRTRRNFALWSTRGIGARRGGTNSSAASFS